MMNNFNDLQSLQQEHRSLQKRCIALEEKLDRVCTTIDQASELIQGDLQPYQSHSNTAISAKMLDMLSVQIETFLDRH